MSVIYHGHLLSRSSMQQTKITSSFKQRFLADVGFEGYLAHSRPEFVTITTVRPEPALLRHKSRNG